MNRSRRRLCSLSLVLGAVISGCSNSTPSEELRVQGEPLAANAVIPAAIPGPRPTSTVVDLGTPAASLPAAGTSSKALTDSNVLSTLHGIGLAASSVAGVSSPTTIRAVAASDHAAVEFALSGAIVPDHAPVYVITMTGGPFTATHHPRRAAAPQGNVLVITVDSATFRVTDVGYEPVETDLSQLASLPVDL